MFLTNKNFRRCLPNRLRISPIITIDLRIIYELQELFANSTILQFVKFVDYSGRSESGALGFEESFRLLINFKGILTRNHNCVSDITEITC